MILPDVNLILYAYDLDSPFHAAAAAWWTKCLSSAEPVGLAQVIVFAFLRLSTSPRIFANPFSVEAAIREVREETAWLFEPVAIERELAALLGHSASSPVDFDLQLAVVVQRAQGAQRAGQQV